MAQKKEEKKKSGSVSINLCASDYISPDISPVEEEMYSLLLILNEEIYMPLKKGKK